MDLDLAGTWRAFATDSAAEPTATGDRYDDSHWHPVEVPGHWQQSADLADHPGPVMYRTSFAGETSSPGRRTWLDVGGVFYQSDVWMDHAYLGDTEGYFVPRSFDVTDLMGSDDRHTVAIEVNCPMARPDRPKTTLLGSYDAPPGRSGDLGIGHPGGIWRPIALVETGAVAIRHFRVVCRDATPTTATVLIRAVLDSAGAQEVDIEQWASTERRSEHTVLTAGENHLEWTITIDDPQRWWPAALGDPHLVSAGIAITAEDGRLSDRREVQTGLRSIELRGWVASINGERMFLKGANQPPIDRWPARVTEDVAERAVAEARSLGLDLVRVVGHVAPTAFYEAADRHGLLVWADLPLVGRMSHTVRRQAEVQARAAVDLLGHHPSVIMWGAHNASGTPRRVGGDVDRPGRARRLATAAVAQQLPSYATTVLDRVVARAVRRADGSRPVISHSGRVPSLPLLDGTDTQMGVGWYVGDLRSLERWAAALPRLVRFVSDFGAQSIDAATAASIADGWPAVDWQRLSLDHGIEAAQLADRVPPARFASPDEWAAATRAYQAEVITHHIETLRRLKYRPAGGFCFTSLSGPPTGDPWAAIDSGHDGDVAEAVAAACAPVIVVADRMAGRIAVGSGIALDIHVVSDLRHPIDEMVVTATLRMPDHEHVRRWAGSIDADSVTRVATLQFVTPDRTGPLHLELVLSHSDGAMTRRTYTTEVVQQP